MNNIAICIFLWSDVDIFNHTMFSMFVIQGNVHNAMLFVDIQSHTWSNGYSVVLDGEFYTEGISKSTDFDLRRHAFAENHRKHKPVRLEIRSAYGTRNSPPLLRDSLSGMYVYVARVRLHWYFA